MRKLYFGLSGEDVKELQINLQKLGYSTFAPTTFFGVKTHLALMSFQRDHKLLATGIFGTTEARLMGITQTITNSEKFFNFAMGYLGKDVTPKDEVPDDVACAQTIDTLYYFFSGKYISGKEITVSTLRILDVLNSSPNWQRISKTEKGCIVLYATGTGNGALANGHIFLSDGGGKLYSNTSRTGLFEQNYTDFTAKWRYESIGGFKRHLFKLK